MYTVECTGAAEAANKERERIFLEKGLTVLNVYAMMVKLKRIRCSEVGDSSRVLATGDSII